MDAIVGLLLADRFGVAAPWRSFLCLFLKSLMGVIDESDGNDDLISSILSIESGFHFSFSVWRYKRYRRYKSPVSNCYLKNINNIRNGASDFMPKDKRDRKDKSPYLGAHQKLTG